MKNEMLSPYLRDCKHSETLRINQLSHSMIKNNQTVYKMGFGQSPFPVHVSICDALAKASHRKEYSDVQGILELRQSICSAHQLLEEKNWSAEQVIVGSGSKILLFSLFSAFRNAEVLLPAPSWVSYEPQAQLAGHQVSWLITSIEDGWRITPQQLRNYCNQRLNPQIPLILVLNYPSNPTGQVYTKSELQQLAEVMRQYNIIVIADEIYSLLYFNGKCESLQTYYPEGCIVTSGLSKWCGAGGWRLGFCHIPQQLGEDFKQAVLGVASETYSCAPTPIQVAAIAAYLKTELAQSVLQNQTDLLNQVSSWCNNELANSGINLCEAQGGFYLFLDFAHYRHKLAQRGITTSNQLTQSILMNTGVALLPGSAFGMPAESLTTRLAFVDFDGEQVYKKELADFDFTHMKKGISLLCDWVKS